MKTATEHVQYSKFLGVSMLESIYSKIFELKKHIHLIHASPLLPIEVYCAVVAILCLSRSLCSCFLLVEVQRPGLQDFQHNRKSLAYSLAVFKEIIFGDFECVCLD